MATWTENDKFHTNDNEKTNYENIIVTHDLQDCIDDSLDKVFGQLPVINYSKYSEEHEKPENTVSHNKTQHKDDEKR